MLEVVLPIRQCLQAVHHGTVEAIGCVGEDQDDDEDIEAAHVWPLPPRCARKLLTREEEVALAGNLGRRDGIVVVRPKVNSHSVKDAVGGEGFDVVK